jgi:hypothetical protein
MMQRTIAEGGFGKCRRVRRREQSLKAMKQNEPWEGLVRKIEPYYPEGGERGAPDTVVIASHRPYSQ